MDRLVCNMHMCEHVYITHIYMYVQKGKEMGIQGHLVLTCAMYVHIQGPLKR